ncbi:MAG: carboxypeptidase regulatory-like domain-containing protein [bacterium]
MKSIKLLFVVISLFCISCSEDKTEYSFPNVISGRITDNNNNPLGRAAVFLATKPEMNPVWTNDNGYFRMENVPEDRHRLRISRVGYQTTEVEVPSAVNGISSINASLTKIAYDVPSVKPQSKGAVRINNKKLEVDFDGDGIYTNYLVKGVAFSPTPIGNLPITNNLLDRCVTYLKELNVNTVRTYSGVDKYFLIKAEENNIAVILGFWVDYTLNLSDTTVRKTIIDEFEQFVIEYKDYKSVLMWNLGNEQNYQNGNNANWYTLCQELAIAAYKIEGDKYHPVAINNGNFSNIGSRGMSADDGYLTYIDLWASNIYQWDLGPNLLTYKNASNKPVVLTEWGIDALDNRTKTEYQQTQADFILANWIQIVSSSDYCIGGTMFEFTDEWWKDTDPWSHENYGGYQTNTHPDGFSNEEFWGLIALSPDSDNDGLDEWTPRKAYYAVQLMFKN